MNLGLVKTCCLLMSSHDGHPGNPPPQPEAGGGADYGDATAGSLRLSGYDWTDVAALEPAVAGRAVRVRGAAQALRAVGRRVAFLVLRQGSATVQCVVSAAGGEAGMVRFAAGLSRESVVDVAGVVSLPREPVRGTTQQVFDVLPLSISTTILEPSITSYHDNFTASGAPSDEAALHQQSRRKPSHQRRRRGEKRGRRRESQGCKLRSKFQLMRHFCNFSASMRVMNACS